MTGVDIVDIVKNVRCELKDTLSQYPARHPINTWFIAYAFTFTSTEDNGVGGAGAFVIPISNGTFRIGFDASTSRERRGEKVASLAEQLSNVRTLDCANVQRTESHRYPILGRVGLAEIVGRTAALLSEKQLDVNEFHEELLFTLQIGGGIHPSVSIVPASQHLRNFSLDATASREDKHRLLITLSPPPPPSRPLKVNIVNFNELTLPTEKGAPKAFAPVTRGTPRSSVEAGKEEVLRKQNRQRSLRNEEQILDSVQNR